MSLGIAILGAGIFSRKEHVPAIKGCSQLLLKAVYSRSQQSAVSLANIAGEGVSAYFDTPHVPQRSLDDLLARTDIIAVVIALPITVQPEIVKRALEAGKHVLSEKPVAKDVETAEDLIRWYGSSPRNTIWSVAENFRFIDAVDAGYKAVKENGGDVTTFSVRLFVMMDENNEYCRTEWRQTPEFQGGFLLDAGIHFIAALRYLLEAAGEDITHVSAYTYLLQKHLAPLDTVNAVLRVGSGRSGTLMMSFGMEQKFSFEIEVVTNKAAILVKHTEIVVTTKDATGEQQERSQFTHGFGVGQEVAAFARSIQTGECDPRSTPTQALMDLKVLQSLLESGSRSGFPVAINAGSSQE